ncbi:MAG: Pr6Pr family membrane protein [Ruminiclostridium sp.]|nr:Pr6Pr family membrane protein [Ruminiclostridium sp.]
MTKSRTAQLIFQSVYCAFGVLGSVACLGLFDDYKNMSWTFYVYFTNLSNFLCLGIMFAELVQTARKKENSFVTTLPALKFIAMLGILLTFFVFNIMLAGGRDIQMNLQVKSILFHVVLPIMYVADWVMFYEHRKTKWYYPLLSISFPIVYLLFVYVRAAVLGFDSENYFLYPYFFLDLDKQGIGGVAMWFGILFVAFVVVGYILFVIDWLIGKRKVPKSNG